MAIDRSVDFGRARHGADILGAKENGAENFFGGLTPLRSLVAFGAILLCIPQAWQLWEPDIFWQIRSGSELLYAGAFPTVDHWSFTAAGEPWLNLQWLSTILLYLIDAASGTVGLVVTRCLLCFGLLLLIGEFIGSTVLRARRALLSSVILPAVVFATGFRLQLRSELFVIILFFLLIILWERQKTYTFRARAAASAGLIFLSSQLHPGVTPFLIVTAIFYIFTVNDSPTKASRASAKPVTLAWRFVWSSLFIALLFLTPNHFHLFYVLIDHLAYYKTTVIDNPDHAPFAIDHFDFASWRWTGYAWLALTVLGLRARQSRARILMSVAFTFGAILRDRVVPFQILFLLPTIVAYLEERVSSRALYFSAALQWGVMLPLLIWMPLLPLGFSINRQTFAVGTVEFLRRQNLSGEIFHLPPEGAYLVGAWPERKVMIDTREMPFKKVQAELAAIWKAGNPTNYKNYFVEHDIGILLLPQHRIAQDKDGQFIDRVSYLFPVSDWAIVAFDLSTMALVRRTQDNAKFIKQNEFILLRPHLPPEIYIDDPQRRSAEKDQRLEDEIARCLAIEPDQPQCWAARSGLIRTGHASKDDQQKIKSRIQALLARFHDHPSLQFENAQWLNLN